MRKLLGAMFERIAEWLNKGSSQREDVERKYIGSPKFSKKSPDNLEENESKTLIFEEQQAVVNDTPSLKVKEEKGKLAKKKKTELIPYPDNPIRDVIDLMEFPFLSLSKNRKNPIIYESKDGTQKIKISRHTGHFLASIYDWDIILIVAGKIQEILNNSSDVPPRKITIPRHELLKALHKKDGKKQQEDLEKSLDRLQLTGISTTVNNKDYKHRAGFGFLDSWGYLERKNDREMKIIRITLSDWLYEICCTKGSLLKPNREYFELTSGLKKFLYRTARKHAGINRDGWEFSIEKLYEKSGSEREFRKFKSQLKAAVLEDDLPEYLLEWVVDSNGMISIVFKKRHPTDELDRIVEKYG